MIEDSMIQEAYTNTVLSPGSGHHVNEYRMVAYMMTFHSYTSVPLVGEVRQWLTRHKGMTFTSEQTALAERYTRLRFVHPTPEPATGRFVSSAYNELHSSDHS